MVGIPLAVAEVSPALLELLGLFFTITGALFVGTGLLIRWRRWW